MGHDRYTRVSIMKMRRPAGRRSGVETARNGTGNDMAGETEAIGGAAINAIQHEHQLASIHVAEESHAVETVLAEIRSSASGS